MPDSRNGSNGDNRRLVLGIDIGGSGIKGAPVDIDKGDLIEKRQRIPTPDPSTPQNVADVIRRLARHFKWDGPIGVAFPAIVRHGVAYSAANIDKSWIGTDARTLFERATRCPVELINDADAAGAAEMALGAGQGRDGTVLILTLGTGIGSALYRDGVLVPNTEFGHLKFKRKEAEQYAADSVREEKDLSWKKWGKRVGEVLDHMEFLLSPDLIIIGGGVSKKHEHFFRYLDTDAEIVPAEMRNEAGIIGAALAAKDLL